MGARKKTEITVVAHLYHFIAKGTCEDVHTQVSVITHFPANFHLSPLQKHVRKVVGGFGRKSCFSTGVRKPGNTYASPTAMI